MLLQALQFVLVRKRPEEQKGPRALTSCRRAAALSDGHGIPSANHQPSFPEYWLIPGKAGHPRDPTYFGSSWLPGMRP